MDEPTDQELLDRYAKAGDEIAFQRFVERHLDAVKRRAQRLLSQVQLSEEVSLTVFTIAARKAAALSEHPAVGAWLARTTTFEAAKKARDERRRSEILRAYEASCEGNETHSLAETAQERLEEGLGQLPEAARQAILKRYVEGQDYRQIAASLGTTEGAARTRISRALAKLTRWFGVRGPACALPACLATPTKLEARTGTWLYLTISSSRKFLLAALVPAIFLAIPLAWQRWEIRRLRAEIASVAMPRVSQPVPEAAPRWVRSETNPRVVRPSPFLRQLTEVADQPLTIEDFVQALSTVRFSNWMERQAGYADLLAQFRLHRMDLAGHLRLFDELMAHPMAKGTKPWQELLKSLGKIDARLALDRAVSLGDNHFILREPLQQWAKRDLQGVFDWLEEAKRTVMTNGPADPDFRLDALENSVLRAAATGLAAQDPAEALALLDRAKTKDDRRDILWDIATEMLFKGAATGEVLHLLESHADDARGLARMVIERVACQDRDLALSLLHALGENSEARLTGLIGIANQSTVNEPVAEAGNWLLRHCPPGQQAEAAQRFAFGLPRGNPARAKAWLGGLPAGAMREAALAGLAGVDGKPPEPPPALPVPQTVISDAKLSDPPPLTIDGNQLRLELIPQESQTISLE